MLPALHRLGDRIGRGVRLKTCDNRIDGIAAPATAATCELDTCRRRGEVELQFLRIGQGDVDSGIATGVHLMAGQSDNREDASTKLEAVSNNEARRSVGDHLEVAARNAAAFGDLGRSARPRRFITDDVEPELLVAKLTFDRLIGDTTG
jgi:hypothetical protein